MSIETCAPEIAWRLNGLDGAPEIAWRLYVYYSSKTGGGSKRLFRKVNDRSSAFYPDENSIRRDGSYIYETFLSTGGTDVKVYTCGPSYVHAEARKAPTLDGIVLRGADKKEQRFPILLNPHEKIIARKVVSEWGNAFAVGRDEMLLWQTSVHRPACAQCLLFLGRMSGCRASETCVLLLT